MRVLTIILILFSIGCKAQTQEEIINTYLKKGAWNHHYLTKEWEEWIDKGIKKDSTIAYLWQQKALPYWKQKKYQLAINFYDKAVALDRQKWLSRRGFLTCIFAKKYESALIDFNDYKNEFGTTFEQDHSLDFYIGICNLQLNKYDDALKILTKNVEKQEKALGTNWVHFLDRYYLAIAYYELNMYKNAISEFDKVLKDYPNFSDAQYYKSICLKYTGKQKEAEELMAIGKTNFIKDYTFTEDSSLYEIYPYQLTWQWAVASSLLR